MGFAVRQSQKGKTFGVWLERWRGCSVKKVKVSSYIVQYPILRIVQSALHFTSLADMFSQTPSQLLWEASSHMLQLMRIHIYHFSMLVIYTAE